MLIIVLILQILIFFAVAGTHSRIAEIEQRLRLKNSFLDDEAWPQGDFLETPMPKSQRPKRSKKVAVKQTTTLKKSAHHASSQKRGNNGRFAKKVS